MTVFPRHRIFRFLATAWLLASVVLLAVTLLRPELPMNDRAALSSLVPVYFMSFPLGHFGVLGVSKLTVALYTESRFVLSIFAEGLILWASLVVLGYVQWFVFLPWVARKVRQFVDFLSKRYVAR